MADRISQCALTAAVRLEQGDAVLICDKTNGGKFRVAAELGDKRIAFTIDKEYLPVWETFLAKLGRVVTGEAEF